MQVNSTEGKSLIIVYVEWNKDDSYFTLSNMNEISNMGLLLHHTIDFSTGGKEVLNLLSSQILYCWTIVAGLCYIGNMANVSNLKFSAKVTSWEYSRMRRLFIITDIWFLMLWLWYRNGVQILICFCLWLIWKQNSPWTI